MSDGDDSRDSGESGDRDDLRERVESEYDFEDFGPEQMDRMTAEEWDAAFDPDSWITGSDLLDRVEADLEARVASGDVFAVVERESDADGDRVVAYSDEGYAVVYADGTVEGRGTVLRDVKPTVALASMPDYEAPDPPADASLPDPEDVTEGSGSLGNLVVQSIALLQLAAGGFLLLASVLYDPLVSTFCTRVPGTFTNDALAPAYTCAGVTLHPLGESAVVAALSGVAFLLFGAFMLVVVANARLSDRFRAEEFRDRLREAHAGERDELPSENATDEPDR